MHFEGNEKGGGGGGSGINWKEILKKENIFKNFFFLSFRHLKSTKKERLGARQGAMELIAERNWMLGFVMRYEKRAKDYGIEEEHKTENGQTQWFKKLKMKDTSEREIFLFCTWAK